MHALNVLVVDDESAFRASLLRRLTHRGVTACEAGSGVEALACLAHFKADVVVLDVKMPDMDGIETLKRIKVGYPHLEVVLLTGHADLEAAKQGMKGGAFDYMLKPVAIEELLRVVEEAGKQARHSRGEIHSENEKTLLDSDVQAS
ncbi:MAG: response regulator [Proteobacteria bacterium]|nr:response regulator [Pseudomonadota bacterium]